MGINNINNDGEVTASLAAALQRLCVALCVDTETFTVFV